jgi:hypothetical protein
MGKINAPQGSSRTSNEVPSDQRQQHVTIPRGSVRQKIAMFENKTTDTNFIPDEQYDLTPVVMSPTFRGKTIPPSPAYAVDPFAFSAEKEEAEGAGEEHQLSPTR